MPVRLNIKKHDGRFANTPKEWSASVSGADVLWPKALEAFLQLHGFTPFKHEDGFKTWTLKKSHNEPPVYLAPILQRKFGVEASREVSEMLGNATRGRPPEDGLELFLGQPKTVEGGRLPLQVVAGSRDFLANCDAEDWDRRLLLAGAGWLPVATVSPALASRFGSMPFRTADAFLAANLVDFMQKPAAEKLAGASQAAMKHLKDSRSQEVPEDFGVPAPEGLDYLDFQKGGIAKVLELRKSSIIAEEMG